jgi:hypothetical protein
LVSFHSHVRVDTTHHLIREKESKGVELGEKRSKEEGQGGGVSKQSQTIKHNKRVNNKEQRRQLKKLNSR